MDIARIRSGWRWLGVALIWATFTLAPRGAQGQELINADAGPGTKTGAAVIGAAGDYWNTFNNNPNMTNGVLVPLHNEGNITTGAGLLIYNMDGQGSFSWGDTMFDSYIHSANNGLVAYLTNVNMGVYDLYLYGHGPNDSDISIFQVHSAVSFYGEKSTSSGYEWNDTMASFSENDNYVKYADVAIPYGASLRIDVLANSGGMAFMNGLQLINKTTPAGDWDSDGRDNAAEIAAGTDPRTADTDGDGDNDGVEHAAGTDPLDPYDVTFRQLAYWSFDDAGVWAGDGGQMPVTVQNVGGAAGYSNGGVEIASQSGAVDQLIYNRIGSSAAHNAAAKHGSIRFRFKPNWSTATGGPGTVARLIDMGGIASSGNEDGSWTLYVTEDGAHVKFVTRDFDGKREHLSAAISWVAGSWYEVNLDYTPANSSLHVDGVLKATGTGVSGVVRMGQLSIGSDGGAGAPGTMTWVDDPCFSDPNTLWEWDDALQDYVAGYWSGGTWVEDSALTHPDTYFRDAYDYCWNPVVSEDGYWLPDSNGDNGSARGVIDELVFYNYPLNGGGSLPAVVFDPASGAETPVIVTLTVPNHPGATIYYTTDNTTPTTASSVYSGPISLSAATQVNAFATETGYADAPQSSASYTAPALPEVTFSPASGMFLPLDLSLSVTDHADATIYYTLDGSVPDENSAIYSAPISLTANDWTWTADQTPAMVDWTTSGNSVAVSSGNEGWKTFDDTGASYWQSAGSANEWVSFEFPSSRVIARYAITSADTDGPKDWTFEGWNGSGWDVLDTRSSQTGWATGQRRDYNCTANGSYLKYRLHVSAGNPSTGNPNALITVDELEMMEAEIAVAAYAVKTGYLPSAVGFGEYHAPASATANLSLDWDGDGLSNADEAAQGTDPNNPDTDGDGLSDYVEFRIGSNPLEAGLYETESLTSVVVYTPLR